MDRPSRHSLRPPAWSTLLALIATALALLAPAAARAGVFVGNPVAGPTAALHQLDGIDLAPDGTGALVFAMDDGGVPHMFVSRLVNGAWNPPERLDADLGTPATQASVAAGDGGRVVVAFANGGNLYVATRASAATGWGRQTLWSGGGASDPSADLSVNGKGYVAFTAPGPGGHDVRAASSRDAGPWTTIGAPLDLNAADDAGAGDARPRVAASADGVGIVVWGESGHVFARRLQGTRPSVVAVDALAGMTLEGIQAASADQPVVATQDDDSFTGVAVRAWFDVGGGRLRPRAVYRRLRGSRFETPSAVDGGSFASGQGSLSPQIATIGTGNGLVTAGNDTTNATTVLQLLGDVQPTTVAPIDSLVANTAAGLAVPAASTARKMLVAWQVSPTAGAPEIHARYRDGGDFGAEQAISRPDAGPTDAADGLAAAADDNGDIAVAYVQDVPGQGPAVMVATVDQPPGPFVPKAMPAFQRTTRPVLAWTTSREVWGRYFTVAIDGAPAGVTGRRSLRPAAPLGQGVHTWQVVALDHRGQQFVARPATVKIDTVAPYVLARLTGFHEARSALRLTLRAADTATGTAQPSPGVLTSGVQRILVDWGDGTGALQVLHGNRHVYRRPGRYTLRIVAFDNAGNRTTLREPLRIAKRPKPPRKGRKPRKRRAPAAVVLTSAPVGPSTPARR